jgi:hypothetical protein
MSYVYRGPYHRTYHGPDHTLHVSPGDVVDWDGPPPDDGFWYPYSSEEDQPPGTGDEQPQEETS